VSTRSQLPIYTSTSVRRQCTGPAMDYIRYAKRQSKVLNDVTERFQREGRALREDDNDGSKD